MTTPASEPRLASDRHDAVLALALGAMSAARRFEAAVSRPARDAAPLPPDDPAVLAALGAIALGRQLQRWIESAAAARDTSRVTVASPVALRDLMR